MDDPLQVLDALGWHIFGGREIDVDRQDRLALCQIIYRQFQCPEGVNSGEPSAKNDVNFLVAQQLGTGLDVRGLDDTSVTIALQMPNHG